MKKYDICIIGGGASGMAAAVSAKREESSLNILILEKKEALGKKLLATGNGRCNITNENAETVSEAKQFLNSLGLVLRTEEEGRVYPYSGRASQVVLAFEHEIERLGIEVSLNTVVSGVEINEDGFIISAEKGNKVLAEKLIIACGGKASPQFGTSGDGYTLAKKLGHTVTRLAPALTPLDITEDEKDLKMMKGARAKARVSLYKSNEHISSESGEVQFTETGVSGIAVFNLSRHVKVEENESIKDLPGKYDIRIDFMPEFSLEEVIGIISDKLETAEKDEDILLSIVDEKILPVLTRKALRYGHDAGLNKDEAFAHVLKNFSFGISGAGGWKTAQVTSGGVLMNEIDENTMESLIAKGLYFAGEITDYDGPCGGFNLNHAWITGVKAGRKAAQCTE